MTSDHFVIWCRNFSALAGYILSKIMKAKLTSLLIPTLTVALQISPSLLAQPPAEVPAHRLHMERHARWAALSDEERTKVKAAHQKAMADPAVRAARDKLRQARREFREILRPALVKADPSIQPILEKLRVSRSEKD